MKTFLSLLLVVLSLIGIMDASYLTYEKLAGVLPPCGGGFDCGEVLNSPWASIGPVPLSAVGLLFYLTVFVLAIAHFLEIKIELPPKHLSSLAPSQLLLLLTSFGFLFSLYLVSIMAFVIQAWCLYCLVSAFISSSLFFTSLLLNKSFFLAWSYQHFIKPIFFLADAETAHNSCTALGKRLGSFSITREFTRWLFAYHNPQLTKTIDGITFPNPVGLSAGFDYNGELTQILPAVGFGFHTIGTITWQPYEGNPKPRLGRFPNSKALLVNKGLKNIGAKALVKKLEPLQFKIPVGISIAATNCYFKNTRDQILDMLQSFKAFEDSRVKHSYYELNISCPNTFGGEPFTSPKRLELLLTATDKLKLSRPMYIKMPIDQSENETLKLLEVLDRHNVQGIIIGNLTKDKTNPDIAPADRKLWQHAKGNVSGKPTWKKSNRLIALSKKHYQNRFTIIGCGGIFSGEDAKNKMDLGADLVQLITGMIFQGPQLVGQINEHLSN